MEQRSGRSSTRRATRARSPWGRPTPAVASRWERLSSEIRSCRMCPLGDQRTHAVVYRGGLTPKVVFIGEAPGAEEDRTGVPFVGRSGQVLDRALASLGVAEDEYGVLNVLKCRPPSNKFDPAAARTCRPYLDRQLELLHPKVVVTLGARALAVIDPRAPPMLVAAGRPRRSSLGPHFPLIHPAAALRSRRLRERWERDVRSLGRWLAKQAA